MPIVAGQELSPLAYYSLLLEHVDYPTQLLPLGPEQPYEQLLVALEQGPDAEPLLLQLSYLNDVFRAAQPPGAEEPEEDPAYSLQFFLPLRQAVPADKLGATAWLLLGFNQQLPFGSMGVNAREGVFFSYTLIKESPEIHGRVLVEVVEQLQGFVAGLLPALQAWLNGRRSFDETEKALRAGAENP